MDATKLKQIPESELIAVQKSLVKYWRMRGLNEADAQDAAQAGIVQCLRKSDRWRRESTLRTFLTAVGKRAGSDYRRKEDRQERIKKRYFGTRLPRQNSEEND